MKEIICEFPSHDLAEQATHAIRQQGFSISEEQFEAKEHQTKTSPVAMAGQLMTFSSQPVPDGFVFLQSKNTNAPHILGCTVKFSCPDEQAGKIRSRLLTFGGSGAVIH